MLPFLFRNSPTKAWKKAWRLAFVGRKAWRPPSNFFQGMAARHALCMLATSLLSCPRAARRPAHAETLGQHQISLATEMYNFPAWMLEQHWTNFVFTVHMLSIPPPPPPHSTAYISNALKYPDMPGGSGLEKVTHHVSELHNVLLFPEIFHWITGDSAKRGSTVLLHTGLYLLTILAGLLNFIKFSLRLASVPDTGKTTQWQSNQVHDQFRLLTTTKEDRSIFKPCVRELPVAVFAIVCTGIHTATFRVVW